MRSLEHRSRAYNPRTSHPDFGITCEPETALLERVRADVGIALGAIIPEKHGSFTQPEISAKPCGCPAGRRRFEFCDTLFEIRAAIAAQIRRFGGCKATATSPKAAANATRLLDNLNTDFIGAPMFFRPQPLLRRTRPKGRRDAGRGFSRPLKSATYLFAIHVFLQVRDSGPKQRCGGATDSPFDHFRASIATSARSDFLKEQSEFEVVVVGAGPAGLLAGLCCAASDLQTAVIGPLADSMDGRTAALLNGSVNLLKRLSIWDEIKAVSEPLFAVRLVDATGSLLRAPEVLFEASEIGLEAFGYNVPNAVLTSALDAAAGARLTRLVSDGVTDLDLGGERARVSTREGGSSRPGSSLQQMDAHRQAGPPPESRFRAGPTRRPPSSRHLLIRGRTTEYRPSCIAMQDH